MDTLETQRKCGGAVRDSGVEESRGIGGAKWREEQHETPKLGHVPKDLCLMLERRLGLCFFFALARSLSSLPGRSSDRRRRRQRRRPLSTGHGNALSFGALFVLGVTVLHTTRRGPVRGGSTHGRSALVPMIPASLHNFFYHFFTFLFSFFVELRVGNPISVAPPNL